MTVRFNLDLPDEHADAIDAVARGLSISRNRVLCAAVEEFLRSRVLLAPVGEPVAPPPQAPTPAGASNSPKRSKAHPWNRRTSANVARRDASMRGRDGAPK